MKKHVFAGVAAFAILSGGGAMAQQGVMTDSTTITRQTAAPAPTGVVTKKTEKVINSSGVETNKTQTYSSGVGGSKSTSTTQTVQPDGSVSSTTHEERTSTPLGESSTVTRSTTTTER
jgi:hypothetical protein